METETLVDPVHPASAGDLQSPGSGPPPLTPPKPSGLGPTPDPTRSGALWVGGAGVALLLAAAAVLTAVRWDDIGQSVKLGGLVAITLALLAAGQKFKDSIPMTAQAIFHLGALLIPFDMAAVAILAGRSWQETLLLTSLTSVVGWYGIERAVPSKVLVWSARVGTIALAAGVAAVSSIAMPVALAVAAIIAVAVNRPVSAAVWAAVAGVLPVASFVAWPSRISGAMLDLGFDEVERWQPLAAGIAATLTLVAVTRVRRRVETAWLAVAVSVLTVLVALGGFADVQVTYLTLAMLFVGVELLALFGDRDVLWKPIIKILGIGAELVAVVTTSLLLAASVFSDMFTSSLVPATIGSAAALLAIGWMIADRRRLDDSADWLTSLLVGSDWPLTTVMFPAAVLTGAFAFSAPPFLIALIAVALAYWMIATWRMGASYLALVLMATAAFYADQTTEWIELAIGGVAAAVLMVGTQLRIRARDHAAALTTAIGSIFVWVIAAQSAVLSASNSWPVVLVLVGAWSLSWVAEARGNTRELHPADWAGRLTAAVVLLSSMWIEPAVAVAMCGSVVVLSAVDYMLAVRRGATAGHPLLSIFAASGGIALGLAAAPIAALAGLGVSSAGVALTISGFVLVGIALASPRVLELPIGVAALVTTTLGLFMSLGSTDTFAVALIAAGCTTMFVGAALRDLAIGVGGYVALGLGVALQLAVWHVDWLEPYLLLPALGALYVGYRYQRGGGNSWAAYAPTIGLMSYVAIADRFAGGSAWHAVIAGGIGVLAIIGGGYRRLVGPLVTGTAVLAIVVGYESLGPAALVPTWAWLAAGGTVLLGAGVAMERSDTSPLERGQHIRNVIATQFS